jgi:hypothetical protein
MANLLAITLACFYLTWQIQEWGYSAIVLFLAEIVDSGVRAAPILLAFFLLSFAFALGPLDTLWDARRRSSYSVKWSSILPRSAIGPHSVADRSRWRVFRYYIFSINFFFFFTFFASMEYTPNNTKTRRVRSVLGNEVSPSL